MSSVFCNLQHSFSPRAFLSLRFRTEGGILLLWHRVPYTIVCSWLYEGILHPSLQLCHHGDNISLYMVAGI